VHRIHYRFEYVLGLILLAITFQLAAEPSDASRLVIVILHSAALVAAVVAAKAHRGVILLSIVAAIVGVAGSTAALTGTSQFGNSSAAIVALLYLLLTPPAIVSGLRKEAREEGVATLQTMFGVLCLYLLIGLLFGAAFVTAEEISGTDFFASTEGKPDDFLYFSFQTLTTVGYGDLVPATEVGRSLAVAEALVGQIYLVTVVALIVSNVRPRSGARRRA
jgi:hypothetical protein